MPDLDALVAEITPELMLDRARTFDTRFVKNAIGGSPDLEGLTVAECEDLYERIVEAAQTADIDIHLT